MVAPPPGHDRRDAIDGAAHHIGLGVLGKGWAWKLCMGVAKEHGVHPRHFSQCADRILGKPGDRAFFKTTMGNGNHQLRALCPHLRDKLACGFHHVFDDNFALKVGPVPHHDLRGRKPDHTHFDGMPLPLCVNELTIQDHIGLERVLGLRGIAVFVGHIDVGIDVRELRTAQCTLQKRQPEIEVMVADVGRVVSHPIHHLIRRMHLALLQRPNFGNEIPQGVPLKQITVVKQQTVGYFSAGCFDQTQGAVQPVLIGRLILVVVVAQQTHMEVGSLQNAQTDFGCVRGHQGTRDQHGARQDAHPRGRRRGTCCHILLSL